MYTEGFLKDLVTEALKERMGNCISFSHKEWNDAKMQTLNDLYANKICLCGNVSHAYFVSTMASILMVMKRITM